MKSLVPVLFALLVPACLDSQAGTMADDGLDPTGDWSVLETFPEPRCNIAGGSTDVFAVRWDTSGENLVVSTEFDDVTTTAQLVDASPQLARLAIDATNIDWLADGGSETADWSFDVVVDEHDVIMGTCVGTIHMPSGDCIQTCAVTGTRK